MNRNMEAVVWALDARGLSIGAWKVLVKMARRVGKRGFDVWPAHKSIAFDAELSVSSVRRALVELEEGGWIKTTARVDKAGDRTSNLYTLQVRMKISHPIDEVEIGPDDLDDDASIPEGRSVQSEHTPHGQGSVQSEQTVRSNRTDGLFTGEQGMIPEEPIQGEESPPTPNGVGTPTEDLFNGSLPVIAETPLDEFVESTWAELKEAYPSVAGIGLLSPARKTKIGARANEIVAAMRKKGEAITPREVWRRVIVDRIPRSRFLTGQAPPGKGYTAPMKLNIDYVLRPAEFLKIFIGDYDDDKRPGAISEYASDGRRYGPTEAALRAEIERL